MFFFLFSFWCEYDCNLSWNDYFALTKVLCLILSIRQNAQCSLNGAVNEANQNQSALDGFASAWPSRLIRSFNNVRFLPFYESVVTLRWLQSSDTQMYAEKTYIINKNICILFTIFINKNILYLYLTFNIFLFNVKLI